MTWGPCMESPSLRSQLGSPSLSWGLCEDYIEPPSHDCSGSQKPGGSRHVSLRCLPQREKTWWGGAPWRAELGEGAQGWCSCQSMVPGLPSAFLCRV